MRQIVITAKAPMWRKWTEARARRATLDRLQKIANLYAEIAGLWGDVDESIVSTAEEYIRGVEEDAADWQFEWEIRDEREGGAES